MAITRRELFMLLSVGIVSLASSNVHARPHEIHPAIKYLEHITDNDLEVNSEDYVKNWKQTDKNSTSWNAIYKDLGDLAVARVEGGAKAIRQALIDKGQLSDDPVMRMKTRKYRRLFFLETLYKGKV